MELEFSLQRVEEPAAPPVLKGSPAIWAEDNPLGFPPDRDFPVADFTESLLHHLIHCKMNWMIPADMIATIIGTYIFS